MINTIPFSIPAEFASGLADGSIVRIGALLKDAGSGHILAHVQETGMAQQLLGGLGGSPFSALGSLNMASSGYANVQLVQLKSMVEGLQTLQYLNLGVTLAGIGVSVIGFALMNKRLQSIEGQISDLSKKIDQHFQNLFERELRKHYSQIYVLFEKADLAHTLSNSKQEWLNIAAQLADESGFFRGEIAHLLKQSTFDSNLFSTLIKSLTLCNAGRIECLMLADELCAAHQTAIVIGQNYSQLFDSISPLELARKTSPNNSGENECYSIFRQSKIQMDILIQGIRDITDSALTKHFLIEAIIEKEISGRDYIRALREENEHPLLLLRHGKS
jgi:hypothetical protein